MTTSKHLAASLLILCAACGELRAQKNQVVTLQEHATTSDSAEATVTTTSGDIKAGENFEFTVTLDKPPNFPGGGIGFTAVAPGGAQWGENCMEAPGDPHRVYHCVIQLPQTAQGGIWTVQRMWFAEGATHIELNFKPIRFNVIPKTNLILPTSAEITVNLDQKQLLRREAKRIQGRIQELKSTVSEYVRASHERAVTPLLRQTLLDSLAALKATEAEFTKLTSEQGQQPNASIFFDDLRRSYEGVIPHLETSKAELGGTAQLRPASEKARPSTESLLALALRPMEQNELAYKVVAEEGSLTFDLEVDSTPEGARVSYFRRGDPPRSSPNQTRVTIPKLPYAIWVVRFEEPGYKTEEREHDPWREPNHVVHVDLQK